MRISGASSDPAQFSRVRDLSRWSSPEAMCVYTRDPSLRLKNGSGQDDAQVRMETFEIQGAPLQIAFAV